MKEFSPEQPKDISPRHKLIAYTCLLAARERFGDPDWERQTVIVHSNKRRGKGLVKELQSLGFKVAGLCDGRTCRWNEQGLNLKNSDDSELSLGVEDSFNLGANILILDELREFIGREDSESLGAQLVVETGDFISNKAKQALQERGSVLIPHQFFDLYSLEDTEQSDLNRVADAIDDNWNKMAAYAKKEGATIGKAFEYLISQDMT